MIAALLTFIVLVQVLFIFFLCFIAGLVEVWQEFDKIEHMFHGVLLVVAAVCAGILMLPGR